MKAIAIYCCAFALASISTITEAAVANPFSFYPSTNALVKIGISVERPRLHKTLSGALVPALMPGDVVTIDLSKYYLNPPHQQTRYHANVVFLGQTGQPSWLYKPASPDDQLYVDSGHAPKPITFTYGDSGTTGIPVVVIVPEDKGAGDLDPGARAYVDKNANDFSTMALGSNDAADKYTWFQSFIQGAGSGQLNYTSGADRVNAVAKALGADTTSCFPKSGDTAPTQIAIANCVHTQIAALAPSSIQESDTAGSVLGVGLTALLPGNGALYATAVASVLKLFGSKAREKYEYLPSPLFPEQIGSVNDDVPSYILPAKIPGIRPTAAISDVLFFTIGTADTAQRPSVVFDGNKARVSCAAGSHFAIPFHLDKTSMYIHDLVIAARPIAGGPIREIPLDVRLASDPLLFRLSSDTRNGDYLFNGVNEYSVSMRANFGFDTVAQDVVTSAIVAMPHHSQSWALSQKMIIAGQTAKLQVSSDAAPCVDEIHVSQVDPSQGDPSQGPVIQTVKTGDIVYGTDGRSLTFTLDTSKLTAAPAQITFVQHDQGQEIDDEASIDVRAQPQLAVQNGAVAYLNDPLVALRGTALNSATGISLAGLQQYTKLPGGTATQACFKGPPVTGFTEGQAAYGDFVVPEMKALAPISVLIKSARPTISLVSLQGVSHQGILNGVPSGTVLSTDTLTLEVQGQSMQGNALPANASFVVQPQRQVAGTCAALFNDLSVAGPQFTQIGADLASMQFRPIDLLANRAQGTVAIQLVDKDAASGSDFSPIPNLTITAAPDIDSVICTTTKCTLKGSQLAVLSDITDAAGTSLIVARASCAADPGKMCIDFRPLQAGQYDVKIPKLPTLTLNAALIRSQ